MKKPESCKGCPFYQDGEGFVPDELVTGAPVFVLGQNPGDEEEKQGRPFVGKTGQAMLNTYFPAAGLRRGENVSIGNSLRCRWQHSNTLPSSDRMLEDALKHCQSAHFIVPESTLLVVAQGALAVRALGHKKKSVTDWRGFILPGGYDVAVGESHNSSNWV